MMSLDLNYRVINIDNRYIYHNNINIMVKIFTVNNPNNEIFVYVVNVHLTNDGIQVISAGDELVKRYVIENKL